MALLLAGILSLQRPWAVLGRSGALPRRAREAAWLAVATGVSIAAYSAVDRVGARTIPPWLYATLIWTFTAVFLLGGIALADRRARRGVERALESAAAVTGIEAAEAAAAIGADPSDVAPELASRVERDGSAGWGRAAIGGLVTVAAYMLVLVAYVFAPAVGGRAGPRVGDRARLGLGLVPARRGGHPAGRADPAGGCRGHRDRGVPARARGLIARAAVRWKVALRRKAAVGRPPRDQVRDDASTGTSAGAPAEQPARSAAGCSRGPTPARMIAVPTIVRRSIVSSRTSTPRTIPTIGMT